MKTSANAHANTIDRNGPRFTRGRSVRSFRQQFIVIDMSNIAMLRAILVNLRGNRQ
jgi:hypothetical protein